MSEQDRKCYDITLRFVPAYGTFAIVTVGDREVYRGEYASRLTALARCEDWLLEHPEVLK